MEKLKEILAPKNINKVHVVHIKPHEIPAPIEFFDELEFQIQLELYFQELIKNIMQSGGSAQNNRRN